MVFNCTKIEVLKGISCMKHITVKVNHNVQTLNGNDTFHGMDIIVSVTSLLRSSTVLNRRLFVKRRQITELN